MYNISLSLTKAEAELLLACVRVGLRPPPSYGEWDPTLRAGLSSFELCEGLSGKFRAALREAVEQRLREGDA